MRGVIPEHRARLRTAGVEAEALDAVEWSLEVDALPQWWHDHGNALYLAAGGSLPPQVLTALTTFPVNDVLIAVASPQEWIGSFLVGGDRAVVFLDRRVVLTAGDLYCGGDSQIVLHGPVVGTRMPVLDARNGGSIVAQADQLWAAHVYVATDDMHRLEDRTTGERLNPFGAHIRLGEHVWLCRDAVVTGHAEVGDGAVVGMRSVVRNQKVPAHTAVAGTPARVVRENVRWSGDDTP